MGNQTDQHLANISKKLDRIAFLLEHKLTAEISRLIDVLERAAGLEEQDGDER